MAFEAVLRWPIFKNAGVQVQPFILQPGHDDADTSPQGSTTCLEGLGRDVEKVDLAALSKEFLAYVHVKNPILDVPEFKSHIRNAVLNGLSWDGPSCLVVLTLPSHRTEVESASSLEAYCLRP